MSEITEKIKKELLKRCRTHQEKTGYDFWGEHIQYVVKKCRRTSQRTGSRYRNSRIRGIIA